MGGPVTIEKVSADLCIMGAGIAGLNVLAVAAGYLSRDQTVVLIDRNPRPGGMWNNAYDYVRLHQPHPMFTAGNIRWTLDRPPSYLASKPEVLDHFEHCVDRARSQVGVETRLGWEVVSHDESGGRVRVLATGPDGRCLEVDTARFVRASGMDIRANDPLELSSSRVRSVSPDSWDPTAAEVTADDSPVWVIGGGKTAMDTAHALIRSRPGREVNLLTGGGTYFSDREKFFPTGRRRWTSPLVNDVTAVVARRFDGSNEDAVSRWYRTNYGTWLSPEPTSFMLGNLAAAENAQIAQGVATVLPDHLVDVVDDDDRVQMRLRSGATVELAEGTWVANCTGYLLKHPHDPEPLVSPSGNVMSINLRSAALHLTSFQGYYTTHLLMRDLLGSTPLYVLDLEHLMRQSKTALVPTMICLAFHNLSVMFDALPSAVFRDCALDFNRWYPVPRQLRGTLSYVRTHRRDRDQHRRTLDLVRERFGLEGGVPV